MVERFQANSCHVGALLRSLQTRLADEHPLIGDVRSAGLFIGVEMVRDRTILEPATAETAAVEVLRSLGPVRGYSTE